VSITLRESKVGHEATEIGVYRDAVLIAVITRPMPAAKWHVHPANYGKKKSFRRKGDAVLFASEISNGDAMKP
jgi:hypothetical protein